MSIARLAILGALMERPMHGYDIRKYFEDAHGCLWMVNYGSIYPTLKSLDKGGMVRGRTETAEGARSKKVYSITEKGRQEFQKLLEDRLEKEAFIRDEFTLHLFFMDYLDKKVIKNILEKKIRGNQAIFDHINEHEDHIRKILSKYRFEAVRRGKMHIETELSWLKSVIKNMEV